MNQIIQTLVFVVLCLAGAYSGTAQAQSLQIIGGSGDARECYRLSQESAAHGIASRRDVEICDRALQHGALDKADMVATLVNRGILRVHLEDFKGAAADYNRSIRLSDDRAEAFVNRGNLWFMFSQFDQAIEDYDRALSLSFAKPHIALLNKGMALETLGKLDAAKENYLAALNIAEEWPIALSKLERVDEKISRWRTENSEN